MQRTRTPRVRVRCELSRIAVLNALLCFYPESHLSCESSLVVFPSNAQLLIRAHGIAGTTLSKHLLQFGCGS
ncbi:hypothetical protein IB238_22315 [Rhizobium sp. ARZ01]|nr:hypothetical protein [Rhizobium sp. ARZ01]